MHNLFEVEGIFCIYPRLPRGRGNLGLYSATSLRLSERETS